MEYPHLWLLCFGRSFLLSSLVLLIVTAVYPPMPYSLHLANLDYHIVLLFFSLLMLYCSLGHLVFPLLPCSFHFHILCNKHQLDKSSVLYCKFSMTWLTMQTIFERNSNLCCKSSIRIGSNIDRQVLQVKGVDAITQYLGVILQMLQDLHAI